MEKIIAAKYDGLLLSEEFIRIATTHPSWIKKYCNGVGSRVGFLGKASYHLIPNTIWGLDITAASDIHDVDYVFPVEFASEGAAYLHKKMADIRFRDNCYILIDRADKTGWLRKIGLLKLQEALTARRKLRARLYYIALRMMGEESFLSGKKIL